MKKAVKKSMQNIKAKTIRKEQQKRLKGGWIVDVSQT